MIKNMRYAMLILTLYLLPVLINGQVPGVNDKYFELDAAQQDPVYTTYAAAMERSLLYGDKAYKMNYYSACSPVEYASDKAGKIFHIWMVNKVVIDQTSKFFKKPVVKVSFPDMAFLEYEPVQGLNVRECFLVYSSKTAMISLFVSNNSGKDLAVEIFPVLELGNDSLKINGYNAAMNGYNLYHYETKSRLISDLYKNAPYPVHLNDIFCTDQASYSHGGYRGSIQDFYQAIKTDFYKENRKNDSLNFQNEGYVDLASLHVKCSLPPGGTYQLRTFRGLQDAGEDISKLEKEIEILKSKDIQEFLDANEKLFSRVPKVYFKDKSDRMVYLSAYNLARGCMLPATGKTSHNFYVFSRNPLWGWGHGHQVLHESLSMLAYVFLDPFSAQESQRVYMEQQTPDGLIAYRHGPRGMQDYPHKGQPTTSAPFYSWINLEIYKVSRDTAFLSDAYESGVRYTNWLIKNRDKDGDGLFEWGPYGIIENVRDWYNVIFQVSKERYLDIDKEDISDELECLDLSLMIISEMRCIAEMAHQLGKNRDSDQWNKLADKTAKLVQKVMWDKETGFFYHVNMKDHSFDFMGRDLRRKEIIGFLALWAGVADQEQADILVRTLTDTTKFWRTYGVPTLSANDPYYSADVDYCCKWNGPVWLLWDYMVFDGLMKYGYTDIAMQLGEKMLLGVKTQLSLNHNFWESYSADNTVLDCPPNYIWDAIMAKLLIEMNFID